MIIQDLNIQMFGSPAFEEYYPLKYYYFRILRININKFSMQSLKVSLCIFNNITFKKSKK